MATFNPYTDALADPHMVRNATRAKWRAICCKCSTERPIKGGTFPLKHGARFRPNLGGVQRKFICSDCLAKTQTAAASVDITD